MSDARDQWEDGIYEKGRKQADEIERLQARVSALEDITRKVLKEQDEMENHHSAPCTNWAFLETASHQCGLCDLREALQRDKPKQKVGMVLGGKQGLTAAVVEASRRITEQGDKP